MSAPADRPPPHVVVVGGGFGGLIAARALARLPVRITLVDRTNHHLFQPLLYQVATAGLSPADIAMPIRSVVRRQRNCTVLLGAVTRVDLDAKQVYLRDAPVPTLAYDFLVLAVGARTIWFGNDQWARYAMGLKDLDEAVEIRRRVLLAFEAAEHETQEDRRRALLTCVVIGGGPTGVEMAGALAELTRVVLARDFRRIGPASPRIVLLEAGPRILSTFAPQLSEHAVRRLNRLGVEVRTGARVTDIDADGVSLGEERLDAATVVWAAGVGGNELTATLGVPLDRAGRVMVEPDCSLPSHPEAFAIGDMAHFPGPDGQPLPGVSPVAMQQGRHVARTIGRVLRGEARAPFRYFDKGSMATIGRSAAIAEVGKLRLSGLLAWLAWLFIHIWYLIGFRNRVAVLMNWAWQYLAYRRGARLVTGHRLLPGPPPQPPVPELPGPASSEPQKAIR